MANQNLKENSNQNEVTERKTLEPIKEFYKDIPGYSNYEVSNLGNIRNKNTRYVLKAVVLDTGYCVVNLKSDKTNKFKRVRIHRAVCFAFLPNPEDKPTVNHIDGNKKNNTLENLEWATHKEQSTHAKNEGLLFKNKIFKGPTTLLGLKGENYTVTEFIGKNKKNMPYYVITFDETGNEKMVDKYKIINKTTIRDTAILFKPHFSDETIIYQAQIDCANEQGIHKATLSRCVRGNKTDSLGNKYGKAYQFKLSEEDKLSVVL